MFDCSDDVLAYHDQKTTLPQAERTAMRERRDANRERLKSRLKEKGKPLPHEFIKQGSYAMRTMVQDPDNDYDIDDGVYFTQASLRGKDGKDMPAKDARVMVCDALKDDRFSRQPQVKHSCVRVFYNEGYHVDIPVYRIRESDGEYELAAGDSWVVSRAADVEDWFNDVNEQSSPDSENGGQFRRMTRMLKKFARSRTAWKSQIAPGFTITKLAAEKYVSDADREDIALRQTMQAIYDRLTVNLEVDHPVTPGSKLTKGPDDAETAFLRDKLFDALRELAVLDDAACTRKKALPAWDKVFNTDFFSQRDASKAAVAAAVTSAYGSGPRIISNPPKPWSR
jgi:hypothetical protein